MMVRKIAIITTHPIQYNAPFFKELARSKHIELKVFYTWGETVLQAKYDPGFQKSVEWDIPLLEGYTYEFLINTARAKGSHHYNGIINPDILIKLTEFNPAAILVYGWKFKSHLGVLRHFKNKILLWFRGDSTLLDEKKNLKSLGRKLFLKWVYGHVDYAFYTGENNKKYFLKNGLKEDQLIKAVHAIDNERFYNTGNRYSFPAQSLKQQLGIPPDRLVFLFAGKLEPKKDVETLLKAFCSISNKDAHLVIAGNGQQKKDLKNSFEKNGHITFLDFQNQLMMPVIYQLCDVFILPSKGPGETWGLSLNEAMAAGKVVIASDKCGGAADLIHEGENGYTFKAGDVKDLVAKMETCVALGDELESMKQKSLETIREFDFEKFVASLENLLNTDG